MYLYHITKYENLDNILKNGLLINSNKNGFVKKEYLPNYKIKYGIQPIFLTNDIDYIIKTQLTESFIKDCCVLKIDISNLDLEDEYNYLKDKWNLYYKTKDDMFINTSHSIGKSFICKENIKPDLIFNVNKLYDKR